MQRPLESTFGWNPQIPWCVKLILPRLSLTRLLQRNHIEVIARNEYMSGDTRDPTACSLYYFSLGKVRLVHGLWRQAPWHKEQAVMLKFLSNDFQESRWKTAALKNAYALLSKQRFGAFIFAHLLDVFD